MAGYCEINHNNKRTGRVEHRSPWIHWCPDQVCSWCLGNRVHSSIKKYMWRQEEYEDFPEPYRPIKVTVHKFAGWPNKKKSFKFWD